jgi:hypothetical protein
MSISFYKPNSKNTGSACSFWLSPKDNRFYACLIKQDSWNAAKRTGSFSQNTNNPQKKVIIKFSDVEIAGILDSIDNKRSFTGYHDGATTQFSTSFKFEPYMRDGNQVGSSFMITKSSKEDTSNKNSFVIGLNFAESRLLKENLIFLLNKSFDIELKALSSKSKNNEQVPQEESQSAQDIDGF